MTTPLRRAERASLARRRLKNRVMVSLITMCTVLAIIPLLLVFFHIVKEGAPAMNRAFFTQLPAAIGETGGGMGNSIVGSLILIVMASLVAVPIGIFGGVYLSEIGEGRVASALRWTVDLMASLPSIVIGLFVYAAIVAPMKSFSAYAGSAALALLMIPIVVKTTEEVLKLLPESIREAGLALGIPRWRVILFIVLRGRAPAVMTGVVLALARIAGETAPLLITAFGNRNWPDSLMQPTPSLPVQIYNFAISPFAEWHRQAWAGAFTLVVLIFTINVFARLTLTRESAGR